MQQALRLFILFLSAPMWLFAQVKKTSAPQPVYPIPTAQQLAWHEMETNAFIHFSTNTFTNKEWGYGDEPESVFNPTAFNATQWAVNLKKQGFKTLILTCKHHDGFCLWPSKYTQHSVKNSPYKNGTGDIVKEVSDAARKAGLHFGVYLSPWDRNQANYGTEAYLDYYRRQLNELFTRYGPITEMWFDGANGGDGFYGGSREKRTIDGSTYYQWPATLQMIQGLQPNVLFFSDAGPHLRWVGNERGVAGETNWNTINPDTLYAGKAGIEGLLNSGSMDGTRWIPAECDVSIRPGWFYHEAENNQVKTPQQLFDIYLQSVGRGATLLLNIPPDTRGLLHETDLQSLEGFNRLLKQELGHNRALHARVIAGSFRNNDPAYSPANITDGNKYSYWATNDNETSGSFEIILKQPTPIRYLMIQEYIALGQRVKSFAADAWVNGNWKEIARATTIGYKRILKFPSVTCRKFRVRIIDAKAAPLISNAALY